MATATAANTTINQPGIIQYNRIDVIDVLRGFALLGIVVVHATFAYGIMQMPLHSRADNMLLQAINYLVEGKFYAIFSFIFGLSFAIQLQSASAKKRNFTRYFVWRSLILLVIGYVHLLFYTGDVLYKYALLGLLLLLANKLNNKVLIGLSIVLIFFAPFLRKVPAIISPKQLTEAQIRSRDNYNATKIALAANAFKAKTSGTIGDVLATNVALIKKFWKDFQDIYFLILGLFLLGLVAGREKLFVYTVAHAKLFTRILIYSLAAAMFLFALRKFAAAEAAAVIYTFNQIALACVYVAGVTLLYWKTPFKVILDALSPAGKMGLTTYMLQTLFGLVYFYHFGFGMAGRLGLAQAVGSGMLFYMIQVIIARWWMSRFRFGPVEWAWRSLTYLKWQPMLKEK
ncbi:MAG: DUF418 domain-containing protein [Mucilaginibacter sp.]